MEHLKADFRYLMDKSNEERIDFILKDLWIGYPRAKEVMSKIQFLLRHPKISRMPSMLLVGDTNNGKTVLLKRVLDLNKPYLTENEDQLIVPILYVQAPPVPDEKRFYNAILDQTYSPYRTNDRIDKRLHQVVNVLKTLSVKILIIDEIQHILGGSMSKRVSFLNVIKYLSNELQISLVGSGIKDAFNAISTDPQLTNRFEPVSLPKWTYDENFLRLLASFEATLPLSKQSNTFRDPKLSKKIFLLSEGILGEISTIMKRCAVAAIENGSEKITLQILDSIDFVPPSERRYSSSFINS